jgi:hypothetical protein
MKAFVLLLVMVGMASGAAGQALPAIPSEPVSFGDGRVVLGGEVAASIGPEDEGFFNYTTYEVTTLRRLRLGVSGLFRVTDRISVLGELRSENLQAAAPFALYARVRPFPGRRIDIQIGRIPPTFGSFSRRAYSHDNPLIGYPLAYQYLTSLRPDAVPVDGDELLRMRGRGWLSNFTLGNPEPTPGVPLVSAFSWDTGVQVTTGWNVVTVAAAVTNGTASNPRVSDDNGGKQLAVRVTAEPATGLILGSSFATGEFLGRRVRALLSPDRDERYAQRAYGADLEYSRDHWILRAETVLSEWQIPLWGAGPWGTPLRAVAASVEGRYTFLPGLYGAARAEHLGFSRIAAASRVDEWDAPVTRLEVGAGYYLQRNVIARVSVQRNTRDGGRVPQATFVSGQLLYWF